LKNRPEANADFSTFPLKIHKCKSVKIVKVNAIILLIRGCRNSVEKLVPEEFSRMMGVSKEKPPPDGFQQASLPGVEVSGFL
jgi:hypothetical protein